MAPGQSYGSAVCQPIESAMARLRVILLFLCFVILAAGLPLGYYYLLQTAEAHQEQAEFWLGIAYGIVVAGFLAAFLVALKGLLLNLLLFLRRDREFDELKVDILIVEGLVVFTLVALLLWLLPLRFSEL